MSRTTNGASAGSGDARDSGGSRVRLSGSLSAPRVDVLDLLRAVRRSACDSRKILLCLWGLLWFVLVGLVVIAAARTFLLGGWGEQFVATVLRPAVAVTGLWRAVIAEGAFGTLALTAVSLWLVGTLVGSVFGLAVTRMAAVELTCDRRADYGEAMRFARRHWHWAVLTPGALLAGALLLAGLAAALFAIGRWTPWLVVLAAPAALIVSVAAIVLVFGLVVGGTIGRSTIATEWSDAFDAITRVYGYSFTHAYRLIAYRLGAGVALLGAALARGLRAALVLVAFLLALVLGLGRVRAEELLESALLEPVGALPVPATAAGWTIVVCASLLLTWTVARLLVMRIVLGQAVYLLLRLRVDRVPIDNIDGYRPDDSAYDPTAQGFTLVEVEEEIRAEPRS